MAASRTRWTVNMVKCFVVILSIYACVNVSLSHEHSNGHADEKPAHFKYSQEANEAIEGKTGDIHSDPDPHDHADHADNHMHEHGHGHEHDHVHGHDHGHSHDQGHGHSHDHGHGHAHSSPQGPGNEQNGGEKVPIKPNPWRWNQPSETTLLWLRALGSTALVSAAPVVILIFIPLDNTDEYRPMLKVLLSFASGGLLGDAFLHLIPHAISPHSHGGEEGHGHGHSHESHSHGDHDHSHDMGVGMWVLTGLIAFLVVEKFVRYIKGGHGHSHGAKPKPKKPVAEEKKVEKVGDGNAQGKNKGDGSKGKKANKKEESKKEEAKDIEVAGYLNLAADFAHNFTDGLAIGASYLAGQNVGIITTITILLHEVPHEIGDFAILVKSGCSKKKAMLLQFSTAAGAMMGTLCSLMAEGAGEAAVAWILPFTAGGFIYIATVSVIPELLEDSKLWQSVKEIFAMLTGVFMMVLIAKFE